MFTKILVGVDGSPGSRDAAALGAVLAGARDADLLLVGAFQNPLLPFPPATSPSGHPSADMDKLVRQVRDTCALRARTRAVPDIAPARALRRTAEQEHASVLVLGSSREVQAGHSGAGRTGRQVVHASARPVIVARQGFAERPGPLRRIVVGVDGSPESRAALAEARALAERTGAALAVVVVADDYVPLAYVPMGGVAELVAWEDVMRERRAHSETLLRDLALPAEIDGEIRMGDATAQLREAAADADLLVVGSRRWGLLARIALGSTSEDLVHSAPCSLLVVPRAAVEPGERTGRAAAAAGRP